MNHIFHKIFVLFQILLSFVEFGHFCIGKRQECFVFNVFIHGVLQGVFNCISELAVVIEVVNSVCSLSAGHRVGRVVY